MQFSLDQLSINSEWHLGIYLKLAAPGDYYECCTDTELVHKQSVRTLCYYATYLEKYLFEMILLGKLTHVDKKSYIEWKTQI